MTRLLAANPISFYKRTRRAGCKYRTVIRGPPPRYVAPAWEGWRTANEQFSSSGIPLSNRVNFLAEPPSPIEPPWLTVPSELRQRPTLGIKMSKPKAVYSMKIGRHRIPFMEFRESKSGDEYVMFPLTPHGFHLSTHPGAHPHMKDLTGFRQDLDLDLLRKVDWEDQAARFGRDLEARAYWPTHRADIVAFPGQRGKTYFEALRDLTETRDFDLVEYLKVVLGGGTIYKVGPKEREAFFKSKVGQGAFLFDKKEGCFAAYLPIIPGRPLLRFGGKFGTMPLHPHLEAWTRSLDSQLDL